MDDQNKWMFLAMDGGYSTKSKDFIISLNSWRHNDALKLNIVSIYRISFGSLKSCNLKRNQRKKKIESTYSCMISTILVVTSYHFHIKWSSSVVYCWLVVTFSGWDVTQIGKNMGQSLMLHAKISSILIMFKISKKSCTQIFTKCGDYLSEHLYTTAALQWKHQQ